MDTRTPMIYTLSLHDALPILPGGASLMIKEGALENPKPDCIVALHVQPNLENGLVGFRSGMYMASCDELYITVKGKRSEEHTSELQSPCNIVCRLLRENKNKS